MGDNKQVSWKPAIGKCLEKIQPLAPIIKMKGMITYGYNRTKGK